MTQRVRSPDGLKEENGEEMLARLRADPKYQELFEAAFRGSADPFNLDNVLKALASFERTLLSGDSPYDQYIRGDKNAISDSAKRGEELFFDPSAGNDAFECFHCHGPPTFSDQLDHARMPQSGEQQFHNTGLYNLDPFLDTYPERNQGVYEVSKNVYDRGRFKAPTLRNIAVTAPYMHDGSVATLEAQPTPFRTFGLRSLRQRDRGTRRAAQPRGQRGPGYGICLALEQPPRPGHTKTTTERFG